VNKRLCLAMIFPRFHLCNLRNLRMGFYPQITQMYAD
jgi:hypothetical protein